MPNKQKKFLNFPQTVLSSVLNLPPSISSTHSPGIFSNINVLTADIEGEIRKTIDLSRKVQQVFFEIFCEFFRRFSFQLRENGLLSKQDDNQQLKTPCTSDVLNAVNEFFLFFFNFWKEEMVR